MKTLIPLFSFLVIFTAGAWMFLNSGIYNVAATEKNTPLLEELFEYVMERSVQRQSMTIKAPPLAEEAMIKKGAREYEAMCAVCHGAPGIEISAIGAGLNPPPPNLVEEMKEGEWTREELFWITKHGIKMTGMPAFGATHSDEEIWAIVAFLDIMTEISPAGYQVMTENAGNTQERGEHTH
ncbi:MAG: c-type cytochrome [Deltaproteobacteria bacterium]